MDPALSATGGIDGTKNATAEYQSLRIEVSILENQGTSPERHRFAMQVPPWRYT